MDYQVSVIEPSLLIETKVPIVQKQTYQLASLTRITLARLFDVVVVSVLQFLVTFFIPHVLGNWTSVAIVMPVSLAVLIIYFMVFPILTHGNTFGKLVFGIRLRTARDSGIIPWYALVLREGYFLFIPWVVGLTATIIAILILQLHSGEDNFWMGPNFIYNLGYVFFLLWFVFLGISIKIQDDHQSLIDLKFDLYVVEKNPLVKPTLTSSTKTNNYQHVALDSMPGNFDVEQLDELVIDEEKVFEHQINLTDLDSQPKSLRLASKQKEITQKED